MRWVFDGFSDDEIDAVARATDEYLDQHTDRLDEIKAASNVVRGLVDLVPQTLVSFGSGHLAPLLELENELAASITLIRLGFYKQAHNSLRSVLELGLLSVAWDADDRAHLDVKPWLSGEADTPTVKQLQTRLRRIAAVREYEQADPAVFDRAHALWRELSGFTHTRGAMNMARTLNPRSNRPGFWAPSLDRWVRHLRETMRFVLLFHLLRYLVGVQNTRLSDKFGLNAPLGGFVEPETAARFRDYLTREVAMVVQRISDADGETMAAVRHIESLPDLDDAAWEGEIEQQDRMFISMSGFPHWRDNKIARESRLDRSDDEATAQLDYIERQRAWAEQNGHLNSQFD